MFPGVVFPVLGTYVEVWGVAQRRRCLRGTLWLHAEILVSPNATNEAAESLYKYFSNFRLKPPDILSCQAEARRLALAT